jgi:hypothetical protein
MHTLIEQLDAELDRWRRHDQDAYDAMIARSHEPATADATIMVDLIRRGHVTHEQVKADIAAHLDAHRQQLEAEAAERQRKAEREERLRPLLAEWSQLAAEVARLESLRPFQGARDELWTAAQAVVASTINQFDPATEPSADSVIGNRDRANTPGRYLRSRGWNQSLDNRWLRPDGIGVLLSDKTVVGTQFDDDLAALRDRIGVYLESHAPATLGELLDDTEAAVAQVQAEIGRLQARRDELAEPDAESLALLKIAAAGLAFREPAAFGDAFLRFAGHVPIQRGEMLHWQNPVGGISTRSDAIVGELRQCVRPLLKELVATFAAFQARQDAEARSQFAATIAG